jgi:hypothetical protein
VNKSESISNLAQALCLFQGEVTNPKNTASNPFFKSEYAPLSEIINTTKSLLAKHGLSVLQSPSGDGEHIIVTTLLMHSSGEWIEGEPLVLKADKITAQGAGSAITYGRRYGLSAILGIASEDDDDGNHATGNEDKTENLKAKPKPAPIKPKNNPINWPAVWANIKKHGYTEAQVHEVSGVESIATWNRDQVNELMEKLKALKNKPTANIPAAGGLYKSPNK